MIDDWRPESGPYAHDLDWFYTTGGPFVLLPGALLMYWRGIDPSMDESAPSTKFRWTLNANEPASDYDRALATIENKYMGLLSVGPGAALVFGDEPLQTIWWAPEAKEQYSEGMFVGWEYADTEEFVIQSLSVIPADIWEKQAPIFVAGAEPSYLIDSGMPGDELGRQDYRAINLKQGSYAIYTAKYKPDEQTSLVLVRLLYTGTS